uniref:Uncharacterized protein n=1 Tax=Tanacetum cinerariifolium TaxID=118510 RepID=A0A6L2P1U0_TANCI|nr:hypothetical protein [Tanacetum cinerariifolium]
MPTKVEVTLEQSQQGVSNDVLFFTHDEEDKEKDRFDPRVKKPSPVGSTNNEDSDEKIHGVNIKGYELNEEETNKEHEGDELYRDVNINLEERDIEMIDAQQTNSSSMSSGFVSNMFNPSPDTYIDSIFNLNIESTSLVDVQVTAIVEPPLLSAITLPPPPTPLITHLQQTPVPTPATIPSSSLKDLPNFSSLFGFDHRLKALEEDFLEFKQTNQFSKVVSLIPSIVDTFLASKMNKAIKTAKTSKSAGKSKEWSKSHQEHTGKSTQTEEPIHADEELEEPAHQEFDTRFTEEQPVDEITQHPDWFKKPSKPVTLDRDWNKTLPAQHGPVKPWISNLARKYNSRDSFNELMDTPLDFLAFVMNRLKVDTLTPELLIGPTFELMKGTCKSMVELEYFLKEVCKATTDKLDWNNPEGQQYPHDLRKPLPLIPNS